STAERLHSGDGAVARPVIEGGSSETRDVLAELPDSGRASPLLLEIREREAAFADALFVGDVQAAAQAMLDLETSLHDWQADTLQSDDVDQGRAALRSMIVRLATLAEGGAQDPRERLGPFVEALLSLRNQARADKRYADADAVRDSLVALGVEVRDSADGTAWDLA
ncbi:MAG: hypothetical protein M3Q68_07280, partial [Actinomycetota bacterium]|nr:hypothetical protein [Actinomycetota bacterium]